MSEDEEKRPRGRPRTLDTDQTLEIAMNAYWRDDPADVSINAICQLAGISKPSLYRAFGNEDGLMRAVLDRYAEHVLSDIFGILAQETTLAETLRALTTYASHDPRMETGCLFYKMRAGKHRLGPETRARVEEIDAAGVATYARVLEARRAAGDWTSSLPTRTAARYLSEQIGLAFTQRAAGADPQIIEDTLALALSALHRA